MTTSLVLIVVAAIVAWVDWAKGKPKPGEPSWPRWVKLSCAVVIAAIGVVNLLDGYFAIGRGIAAYKNRDLLTAIEHLNKAHSSPFKNRTVIDHLGLAHKNIGDQAKDAPVARLAYNKSLEYFVESRRLYPNAPFAKNGMINVYRRLKNWDELLPLARSFESELKSNRLEADGRSLSKQDTASFLTTLGSVYADQDNPRRSNQRAVELYNLALELDPGNMFAVLNLPPRLLDIAASKPQGSKERAALHSTAYSLAERGTKMTEERDQVFAMLGVVQLMLLPDPPPAVLKEHKMASALQFVEARWSSIEDFDVETWFVLTEAYLKEKKAKEAKNSFNEALVFQARFSKEQHAWAKRLWPRVVAKGDYPFQEPMVKQAKKAAC
jgi:tetratricopeptide (TPR) repeat protein